MNTILEQGIKQTIHSFDDKSVQALVSKMEQYIKELILFNSAYNLTNTSDHDELVVRHILDSLAGYELIKKFVDERLSSFEAEEYMHEAGVKTAKKKGLIDQVAGTIILQSYLDFQRGD